MMREIVANLCHRQWSGWMKYLFSKGTFNSEDRTWIMPKWAVDRWTRQLETPYEELSEEEKDSDRAEADRFIAIEGFSVEDMSDGYHTFNELYQHRHVLFINLVLRNLPISFKTKLNDKKEAWEGWFILGMNTEFGQITYHLPVTYWDMVSVKEVEYNFDYDGHTPEDVVDRLTWFAEGEARALKRSV